MAANDPGPADSGSVADTVARLEVWARHAPRGLAWVQCDSEHLRRVVVRRLVDRLSADEIPFHEIDLPARRPPSETVRSLVDRLSGLDPGVVSLSGLSTAVPDDAFADFLRVLNFGRESLSGFPLNQIWWLTGRFRDAFLRVAPDLNSWFLLRLQLTEEVRSPDRDGPDFHMTIYEETPYLLPEDRLRQISALIARVRGAVAAGTPPVEVLELAGFAARLINNLGLPGLTGAASDELRTVVLPTVEDQAVAGSSDPSILNDLASIYRAQGRWAKAIDAYERTLDASRQLGDREVEGMTLYNLGDVYLERGRWAEAVSAYEQALEINRQLDDRAGEGVTLKSLGSAYRYQGRWAEAVSVYERALEISRQLGDRAGEAHALNNLGTAYQDQGRWAEAMDVYKPALVIWHEYGDRVREGRTLNNLGNAYSASGRWAEAIDAYERALKIRREYGDRAGEAMTLNNLGIAYRNQGRWAEADAAYMSALEISRQSGDRMGEGLAWNNLGAAHQSRRQWTEAASAYERALEISRHLGDRPGEGRTLYNLAVVSMYQEDIPKALDFARESVTVLGETEARKQWENARKLVARLEAAGN